MQYSPTIRAIDIGYGNTKYVTSAAGSRIQCELVPSRAPRYHPSAMGGDGTVSHRRNDIVDVDGEFFEVGPDTDLFHAPPILHDAYPESAEYLALYRACLGRMQASSIDVLITGLPVSQLAQKSDALGQRLRGKHPVPGDRVIEVGSVQVFAQPLGGLVDHCLLRGGGTDENSTHLLIDPGYHTFDWVVAKGLVEVPALSGSYACGVSDVLHRVGELISETTRAPFEQLAKLDAAVRTGVLELRGKSIELAGYLDRAHAVWSDALTSMQNNVGDGGKFDRVYIVGGGAPLVAPRIRARYPDHPVHVVANSVFANVRGFQALGHFLARRAAVA